MKVNNITVLVSRRTSRGASGASDRSNERCGHFGDFSEESFQPYVSWRSETKLPVKALRSLSSKCLRLVCLAFTRNQVFWQRGSRKLLKKWKTEAGRKIPQRLDLTDIIPLSFRSPPPCDLREFQNTGPVTHEQGVRLLCAQVAPDICRFPHLETYNVMSQHSI